MSYRKYPFVVEAKKNQQDRSRKECLCGGHSAKDVKKNLHHHSTKARFKIKLSRRYCEYLRYPGGGKNEHQRP